MSFTDLFISSQKAKGMFGLATEILVLTYTTALDLPLPNRPTMLSGPGRPGALSFAGLSMAIRISVTVLDRKTDMADCTEPSGKKREFFFQDVGNLLECFFLLLSFFLSLSLSH